MFLGTSLVYLMSLLEIFKITHGLLNNETYVQSRKIILHLDIPWDISNVHDVHLVNLYNNI
jgi:hypothetical protein